MLLAGGYMSSPLRGASSCVFAAELNTAGAGIIEP
jgi:hypothetical protein